VAALAGRPHQMTVYEIPCRERGTRQGYALSVDRGVDHHAGAVQDRAVRNAGLIETGFLQPVIPVRSTIHVDQGKFQNIGRLAEAVASGQQFRAAHGKQLLLTKSHGVETGPVAIAVTNGKVHFLAREIHVMQRCGNAQVYLRMGLGKMAEPVHQPFGGKVWRRRNREHAGVLPLQQPLGADGDTVERVAHDGKIVAPGFGDDQALALAIEQLYGKLRFQSFDLVTHRALGDAKLFGGARKALMPRSGFKGFQGIERRQVWAHRTTS